MEKKVALVTAGTSDIAKAIIEDFLQNDYIVYYTYRQDIDLELDNPNLHKVYYSASVDYNDNLAVIDTIIKNHKRLDILVNTLGKTDDKLIMKMSVEDFSDVINTNLVSMFGFCKAALKIMSKQKSGKIVNISSIVGITGNMGQSSYAASKAGIVAMSKSMAAEYGRKNINVNIVSPGFIQTKMTKDLTPEILTMATQKTDLKRLGTTKDVADVVSFLVSDQASYISGQNIVVDGGMIDA